MRALFHTIVARLRDFLRPAAGDADFDQELELHLAMAEEDKVRRGLSPEQARREARLELGSVAQLREAARAARGLPWVIRLRIALGALTRESRYALRGLRRAPGFTAAVVLMLGTGIAATVSAFALADAMVFRPGNPGVTEPETLVSLAVSRRSPGSPFGRVDSTYDDFLALQTGIPALSSLSARAETRVAVSIDGTPLAVDGAVVSDNYFDVVGMSFTAGRGFDPNDSPQPQVVISHDFRRRHFDGASAVGAELVVNGESVRVTGVMAPADAGSADVWIPFAIARVALRDAEGRPVSVEAAPSRYFRYEGRLAPGATIEQARVQASAVARAIESLDPGGGEVGVEVNPLRFGRPPGGKAIEALAFLAVPLIVLAIACLNAASLLLARSTRRGHEWTVRLALGSPAYRLVGYVLLESLLLAAAAAGLGLFLATRILSTVERYLPSRDVVVVDLRVVLFTIAVALFTALAFGLGPAWHAVSRASAGGPAPPRLSNFPVSRTRLALLAVQTTLSLALLAVGWQFVHAVRASNAAIDFRDADRVLVASFDLDPLGLPASAVDDLCRRLLERTAALPAVEAAALTNVPIRGAVPRQLVVRAWPQDSSPAGARSMIAVHVDGDTVDALDLEIEEGRSFRPEDSGGIPKSVIVNRALADREFGGHALGRTFEIAPFDGNARYPVTVIGVVATSRGRPSRTGGPTMLLPSALAPTRVRTLWIRPRPGMVIDAATLHAVVRQTDPRVPIDELTTAGGLLALYDSDHVAAIDAIVALGIVALLLSAAGLYGLLSYMVSMRAKEMSVRAVLGAAPMALVRMTVRQSAVPVGIGLACGAGIAVAAGLVLRSLIYGSSPVDPVALAGASAVLVLVMGAAAAAPAWRAARVDPMVVLRHD
jgi:predicted permease